MAGFRMRWSTHKIRSSSNKQFEIPFLFAAAVDFHIVPPVGDSFIFYKYLKFSFPYLLPF